MFVGQSFTTECLLESRQWDAYPKLPPTESFPAVKLDKGLYYVNAFEPCVSPSSALSFLADMICTQVHLHDGDGDDLGAKRR